MENKTASATCVWYQAWIGKCGLTSVLNGCCKEHQHSCCSCGSPATRDCEETGQFVCGAPLCDNCEHTIQQDGTNGGVGFNASAPPEGMKAHCRKADQRFKPWSSQVPNTQHTPGPWAADGYHVRQKHGRSVADICYTGPHHTPESEYPKACKLQDEANARLIAAAPEMLDTLEHLSDEVGGSLMEDSFRMLQNAIKNAKGTE